MATATDYLPEAIGGYLRLPRQWADSRPIENGKTSLMLLIDQLDLLGATMDKIFDAVVRVDADALIAHGRFLQEKFGHASTGRDLDLGDQPGRRRRPTAWTCHEPTRGLEATLRAADGCGAGSGASARLAAPRRAARAFAAADTAAPSGPARPEPARPRTPGGSPASVRRSSRLAACVQPGSRACELAEPTRVAPEPRSVGA